MNSSKTIQIRQFGGPEVRAAMHGHILAQASLTGTYTLNPQLQK